MKRKAKTPTTIEMICRILEITEDDLQKTPKELALSKDDTLECYRITRGFSVRNSNRHRWGIGKTEDEAWFNALAYAEGWLIGREEIWRF